MGKIDHTKRLAFTCPVQHCGRSFSVLSNMRRHARSHGSYAVSLTESASDHYPLSLSSASSDLGLSSSSPIQSHDSHRRYGNTSSTSGSGSTSRKKNCNFSQWRRREILRCNYHTCHWTRCQGFDYTASNSQEWQPLVSRNFTGNFYLYAMRRTSSSRDSCRPSCCSLYRHFRCWYLGQTFEVLLLWVES